MLLAMRSLPRRVFLFFLFVTTLGSVCVAAQGIGASALVTQPVDEKNVVVLKGNVHPLARAQFDRGGATGFEDGPDAAEARARLGSGAGAGIGW
ncbi:MAG: hypothetical protein WCE52_01615 [Candidatus Acidiferrum sp.]